MSTTSIAVLAEILGGIRSIEEDASLLEETNFDRRADAIDFLEFHILDRIAGSRGSGAGAGGELDVLRRRAEQGKKGLESVDEEMFVRLRQEIADGLHRREGFWEMVGHYTGRCRREETERPDATECADAMDQRDATGRPDAVGYDNLDLFINGLLSDQPIPAAVAVSEPDMVFYQKTPARIVFELTERAGMSEQDIFFDIGSGLGQVAILVHLITGSPAWGVDRDPAYCDYAAATAFQLNLTDVGFLHMDAREADYSQGTTFFLYTPFGGGVLQDMLRILKKEAASRAIRIFTYGPCSVPFAAADWLVCVNGNGEASDKLYEFIAAVPAAELSMALRID